MTLLWLFLWLCNGFPLVAFGNSWFVALVVMVVIDLGWEIERISKRRSR